MIIKVVTNSKENEDDIFRFGLNTEIATAHDYIGFINDVTNFCLKDIESLEKEANLSGKTIKHDLADAVGSIPKDPQ